MAGVGAWWQVRGAGLGSMEGEAEEGEGEDGVRGRRRQGGAVRGGMGNGTKT